MPEETPVINTTLFSIMSFRSWPSPSAETARDTQRFAGDPRGIGRSEKDRRRSNVLRLADAAQRCLCFNAFAEIALVEAGCAHSLRFHHTGIDGMDPNFARAEFFGQRSGDGSDRTLCAGVNRRTRRCQ